MLLKLLTYKNLVRRLLGGVSIGLLFGLSLGLSACSTATLDQRMQYWKEQIKNELPVGASKLQAQDFFKKRGAQLTCCVSMSREKKFHYVSERKVGYSLFMEYDVVVLVEFSSDDTVHSVTVQSWGVGF